MRSITLKSPAKLNLYLRVQGKRRDGYHNLFTLFHRISLVDTLTLTKQAKGFSLRCSAPELPVDDRNLVTRAYFLLKNKYPSLGGLRASLKKRIPLGAGLGGGSSNAAALLLGANRIYRLGLSRRSLLALGRRLGADVPFFLYETKHALARGRGDLIQSKPCPGTLYFLLVLTNKGLSTKDVFCSPFLKASGRSLTKNRHEVRMLSHFFRKKNYRKLAGFFRNDLESPAFCLRPEIRKQMEVLTGAGFSSARMSGSGPTLFITFSSLKEVSRHRERVRRLFPKARLEIAHTF